MCAPAHVADATAALSPTRHRAGAPVAMLLPIRARPTARTQFGRQPGIGAKRATGQALFRVVFRQLTEERIMFTILAAVNPSEARGFFELLIVFLGVTKLGALAVAAGAGLLAWNQHSEKQDTSAAVAFMVACGAMGWFFAGLAA
jgi:hypothetical protein